VELDAAETATVRPYRGGYYVRVRLPRSQMERLRRQARAKAAAYAHLDRLDRLDPHQAGQRLQVALQGLAAAREDGVLEGGVAVSGRTTTFEAFFRDEARQAARALRLLPVRESGSGEGVRLHVLHEPSLAPQPGLAVAVAGERHTTTEDGGIPLSRARARPGAKVAVQLAVPGAEEALSEGARTLGPVRLPASAARTRLHVHSTVASVPVIVRRHGRRVARLTAPGSVALEGGGDYTLHIPEGQSYQGTQEPVHLPREAAHAYRILRPRRAQHGRLRLSAADSRTWLHVAGPQGRLRSPGEIQLDRAPAGSYRVVVARPHASHRQRLRDAFTLPAGKAVERAYRPLPHRLPYQGGYSLGVTPLHPGRGPAEGYRLPQGSFGEHRREHGTAVGNLRGAVVDFQSFWPPWPLTWQLTAGALRGQAAMDTGSADSEAVADLAVLQAGAGLGLYSPLWRGADPALVGWLTGGGVVEGASWDTTGYDPEGPNPPELAAGRAVNGYGFLEAGLHWGWLKLAARWPLDRVEPHLQLGVGWLGFRSGYRRPPATDAQPGLHYQRTGEAEFSGGPR
jgi:hypothetical protein